MSRFNNSGDVPNQPSDDAPITQSISELKGAIGQLWRRVDQAEINANQEAKKIQEKLDTWIASNRALLEVIALNSQETKKAIESSENVSHLLASLSNQLQQFEQVVKQLQQTSPQPNVALTPLTSSKLQALSKQIQDVQTTIARVDTNAAATWTVIDPLTRQTVQIGTDLNTICGGVLQLIQIPENINPTLKTLNQSATSNAREKSSFSLRNVGLGIAIVFVTWFGFQRFDQLNRSINDFNANLIQWRKSTK